MAVLLYFLIKPPEQYIHAKVGNRFVSYGTVILTFIITMYFLSIFLYEQLSLFVEDVPEITAALEEKRAKYAASDLYGLEIIFSDSTWVEVLASPSNIETFVLAILGSLGAFVGTMVTVLIFLLFIVLEEHTIAKRFRAAFPASTGRVRQHRARFNRIHQRLRGFQGHLQRRPGDCDDHHPLAGRVQHPRLVLVRRLVLLA